MKELTNIALNKAQLLGATYADIRTIDSKSESILIKNGKVEAITRSENSGFGVRILADGAWGFASSFKLEPDEIESTTALAFQIARASSLALKEKVVLGPVRAVKDHYETLVEKDPFEIPLATKLTLLAAAEETMRTTKGVSISQASLDFSQKNQIFASTEGAYIEQKITTSGGGIMAQAIRGGEIQQRSYPNSHGGQYGTAGYEFIEPLGIQENAQRVAEEAVALLSAPACPSTKTTLIIDSSQLGLQIHESIGHPTELDRVVGMEASFAGTSFLTLDKLKKYKFGTDIVNITADATIPGALGTFGYDDEGIKSQRTKLVEKGTLVGYLTSRETSHLLGEESNGTMRADGWNRIPLIRMTNINLEPGGQSLEEIISQTREGVYFETNKSWSIDDKRLNFQFACEIGWEIKNGKRAKILKNPNYTGITPEFWGSCDAIADEKGWKVWGLPNCGKGEPTQIAKVAHGTSPARFRNVQIGVGR